jgi:hypothetical protein
MNDDNFKKSRKMTVHNLEMLQDAISNQDHPQISPEEKTALYNQLCTLLEEAHATKNISELESVITQGQTIERQIELWFAQEGKDTLEITWETPAV